MQNAWNVKYEQEGSLKVRVFEGESPKESGAVPFAKELRRRGLHVEVCSRRKAFAPPARQLDPPAYGMLWCPYCIKWREFEESSVVHKEYETPVLLRCPVCTISIMDAYVRRFNPLFIERHLAMQEINKAKAPAKPRLRRRRS